MNGVFSGLSNLKNIYSLDNNININICWNMFRNDTNLINIDCSNWSLNVATMTGMFYRCNNLSNESINNIINMCLNVTTRMTNTYKNLSTTNSYSPFNTTNISNTRYQSRWEELTAAGWKY